MKQVLWPQILRDRIIRSQGFYQYIHGRRARPGKRCIGDKKRFLFDFNLIAKFLFYY